MKLTLTLTYKNGLDEKDTKEYSTTDSVEFAVRKGEVLPSRIEEDTTLHSDNYYIIPNLLAVTEGATLTIEEGTQIQFWCSDPADAYAEDGIAYIKVEGTLLCKGTEERPIEMFPSEWMSDYRVEISKSSSGHVTLKHTNIVNPYIEANEVEGCAFKQNKPHEPLNYRYFRDGKVQSSSDGAKISADTLDRCEFSGLNFYGDQYINYHYVYNKLSAKSINQCTFTDLYFGSSSNGIDSTNISQSIFNRLNGYSSISASTIEKCILNGMGTYYDSSIGINSGTIDDSSFYQIRGSLSGTCKQCIFADCGISYGTSGFDRCVFYGNEYMTPQYDSDGELTG